MDYNQSSCNPLYPGMRAVRRLAYEAADCGLLSADLADGIRRVKGVKKLGVRLGNWRGEVGATRSATDLCSALPCFGRRVGADPIPLEAYLSSKKYLGCKHRIRSALNDHIGIEPNP